MKSIKVKTARLKGSVWCWAPDQNPDTYSIIRVSNARAGEEICPQEIRNAARYVLRQKDELAKDDLIKEVSRLFGYKRLGKNLEAVLGEGIQYARSSGAIASGAKRGSYKFPNADDSSAE